MKAEQKRSNLRQIMNRKITRSYRDVFERWRITASFLEVIRFNNEEGPVRLQVEEIEKEIYNLKLMLKDKMIFNDDEIKSMLDKSEAAYRNKVEKSFCRMFIYGDGIRGENDDWLKAYCLD